MLLDRDYLNSAPGLYITLGTKLSWALVEYCKIRTGTRYAWVQGYDSGSLEVVSTEKAGMPYANCYLLNPIYNT